jgi:hypothetical protein
LLKRLVIMLALLVGCAALADRGLATVAGNAVGSAVQRSEGLSSKPDVTFKGFPFLTQAFGGRFDEVTVEVRDYEREGLVFDRIEASLKDVKVGLGDALGGEVEAVPIGSGLATVTLRFADLNDYLSRKPAAVSVTGADGVLVVTGSVPNVGQVRGRAVPTLSGSTMRVAVRDVRRADGTALPAAAVQAAQTRLSFTLDLGRLPFGISLVGLTVEGAALKIAGRADAIVVKVR